MDEDRNEMRGVYDMYIETTSPADSPQYSDLRVMIRRVEDELDRYVNSVRNAFPYHVTD